MAVRKLSRVDLRKRDLDILEGLFQCRVMKLGHIRDLYFDGKAEMAKKRVQKLKALGFIRQRKRQIGDPSILHIGNEALAVLRESGRLDDWPQSDAALFEKRASVSELTLQHELAVMDVRAAFSRSLKKHPHLSLQVFATWPRLHQFTTHYDFLEHGRSEVLVKPDGFIQIQESAAGDSRGHSMFLEVDRGTEKLDTIARKATCYLNYYHSGDFAQKCGASWQDRKKFPFRVLVVCKTKERVDNIARRLLRNDPPVLTQFWLTTIDECVAQPFSQIWRLPKDKTDLPLPGWTGERSVGEKRHTLFKSCGYDLLNTSE